LPPEDTSPEAGFSDHLIKPVDHAALMKLLARPAVHVVEGEFRATDNRAYAFSFGDASRQKIRAVGKEFLRFEGVWRAARCKIAR
jgi:hypothetical protein